jgi:hypothetical protein
LWWLYIEHGEKSDSGPTSTRRTPLLLGSDNYHLIA